MKRGVGIFYTLQYVFKFKKLNMIVKVGQIMDKFAKAPVGDSNLSLLGYSYEQRI